MNGTSTIYIFKIVAKKKRNLCSHDIEKLDRQTDRHREREDSESISYIHRIYMFQQSFTRKYHRRVCTYNK